MDKKHSPPSRKMIDLVEESHKKLLAIAKTVGSKEGGWNLHCDKDNVRSMHQTTPSSSAWRCCACMYFGKCDPKEVLRELTCYDRRIKWDKSITSEKVVQTFRGGYQVLVYTTRKALGGVIKPRVFIDCTQIRNFEEKDRYVSVCVAWEMPEVTKQYDVHIVARNMSGGGIIIERWKDKGTYRLLMVGQTDLGGWLPSRLTNGPTADAYHRIFVGLAKKIECEFGGEVFSPP